MKIVLFDKFVFRLAHTHTRTKCGERETPIKTRERQAMNDVLGTESEGCMRKKTC